MPINANSIWLHPVCSVLQEGVAAIFGPENPETASHVQSICDAFEVPHIEVKWDHVYRGESYLFNLAPHPETLSKVALQLDEQIEFFMDKRAWWIYDTLQAYSDLVLALKWETFLILYEDEIGLLNIQEIVKAAPAPGFNVKMARMPEGNDFRYNYWSKNWG